MPTDPNDPNQQQPDPTLSEPEAAPAHLGREYWTRRHFFGIFGVPILGPLFMYGVVAPLGSAYLAIETAWKKARGKP
jgi:hypothetical protein